MNLCNIIKIIFLKSAMERRSSAFLVCHITNIAVIVKNVYICNIRMICNLLDIVVVVEGVISKIGKILYFS